MKNFTQKPSEDKSLYIDNSSFDKIFFNKNCAKIYVWDKETKKYIELQKRDK